MLSGSVAVVSGILGSGPLQRGPELANILQLTNIKQFADERSAFGVAQNR